MRKTMILVLVALLAGLLAIPSGAQASAAEQAPVTGTTGFASGTPGTVRVTPSGVTHQFGDSAVLWYAGDIEGSLTCYYRPNTITFAGDRLLLVFSCSTVGEFTWDGRTGPVRGGINGNCIAEYPYAEFACSGTNLAHGSGDLDGVTFRTTWSGPYPSASPFSYEGFAVDPHG